MFIHQRFHSAGVFFSFCHNIHIIELIYLFICQPNPLTSCGIKGKVNLIIVFGILIIQKSTGPTKKVFGHEGPRAFRLNRIGKISNIHVLELALRNLEDG